MASYTIPVLKKSIAVLKRIASGRGITSMKALEADLEIPHSTMYRMLETFAQEDWVRKTEGGQFELSFGLLPLLQPLMRHELLIETTRDSLVKLSRETGLTTKLSVRDRSRDVTLHIADSPHTASIHVRPGGSFHLVIGASGSVLLSGLDPRTRKGIIENAPSDCWKLQSRANVTRRINQVLKLGACADRGSYRPNIFAISAPLHDRSGAVIAAITAIGFREDFAGELLEPLRRSVVETARQCDALLHGSMSGDGRAEG